MRASSHGGFSFSVTAVTYRGDSYH